MRTAWVLGWGVPEPWFAPLARRQFPADEHVLLASGADALARLAAAGPFDRIVGYSLGALLLLGAADQANAALAVSAPRPAVALLAPVFAFPAEEQLGGRVARTQVRALARWLRRDPAAARADFYQRAGLDVPAALAPTDVVALAWGLTRLENDRVAPPLPAGWTGWCGTADALLDAARLRALDPRIRLVPGATHHPAALLAAFAASLPAAV